MLMFILLYILFGLCLMLKPLMPATPEVDTEKYITREYVYYTPDPSYIGYRVCPVCGGIYWGSTSDMSCGSACEQVAIKVVLQDGFKPTTYAGTPGYCGGCNAYTTNKGVLFCTCCLVKVAAIVVGTDDTPAEQHPKDERIKLIGWGKMDEKRAMGHYSRKRDDKRKMKPITKAYKQARAAKYNYEG